eukprot:UN32214
MNCVEKLQIMVFNRDIYTMDSLVGTKNINIEDLEANNNRELTIKFKGAHNIEIKFKLRRCFLASRSHANVLVKLMAREQAWTQSDLKRFGLSLKQLTGEEAWLRKKRNPVIDNLINIVAGKNMTWTKASCTSVEEILRNQNYLHTPGQPTPHLYFSGLCFTKNGLTPNLFLKAIQKIAIPKYVYIGKDRPCTFAVMQFKSIKDSTVVLAIFQHKRINNNTWIIGFGKDRLRLPTETPLEGLEGYGGPVTTDIKTAGFVRVYDKKREKWISRWCALINTSLHIYSSPADRKPHGVIPLEKSVVVRRGDHSVQIHLEDSKSYFFFVVNKSDMEQWFIFMANITKRDFNPQLTHYEVECCECERNRRIENCYTTDLTSRPTCISCLRSDILRKIEQKNGTKKISTDYSIHDLRDLLAPTEFNNYLDLAFDNLVTSDANYVTCPNCSSTWEFIKGSISDAPNFSLELGIDNRPIKTLAQQHYLSHRVCCRECGTNFCRSCREVGYHKGFSCEDYEIYKNAEHCRYCSVAIMPETKCESCPSAALENICNNPLCLEKRKNACVHTLPCGHPCFGIRGEKECPPCLHPECQEEEKIVNIQKCDEFCNICFSDSLSSRPVIQLDCGHIFHHSCVNNIINQKQDNPRVQFGYLQCPLCKIRMSHPMLEFEEVQTLHRDLELQTFDVLKDEQMLACDELINPTSEYYKNPVGFGLYKKLAFYRCHQCSSAYYGGMAQCADNLNVLNPKDFICSACSGIGFESCVRHGKDYIVHKCRFCCSVSQFKCWGTTHFCKSCHDRQEAHDYMTTKSKKDLEQCPGPEKCKLGVKHPPNGEEFSLGCALCRGNDIILRSTESNLPIPAEQQGADAQV